MMKKKVLFIHYRLGERDGVSLEIEKRISIMDDKKIQVFLLSGNDAVKRKNSYVIPEIDIKKEENLFLLENFFTNPILSETEAKKRYQEIEAVIIEKLTKILQEIKPDLLFVHNVLAYARNLPATTALIKVLDQLNIPTVAIHHDFWFERPKFKESNYIFINKILEGLPPKRQYIIKQQVINSLAQKNLLKRRNIHAERIGDYFNYRNPFQSKDNYNADILPTLHINPNDIVVLHATRIIERKAIENALLFVKELQTTLKKKQITTFGGKQITSETNVYLLFSNFVEVDGKEYYKKLNDLANDLKIKVIWGENLFLPERKIDNKIKKYSFWDAYVYADLVTYTSIIEGFGNQLLEAFYFKKMPVVFEYEVFKTDIKPEKYAVISLGDSYTSKNGFHFVPKAAITKAIHQTIELFQNEEKIKKLTDENFKTAEQFHDEQLLKNNLLHIVATI